MTDRPIIFSAPMVRALLDGRKTQTRRVLKPRKGLMLDEVISKGIREGNQITCAREMLAPEPYAPGDRLYVRETVTRQETDQGVGFQTYAADGSQVWPLTQWYHQRKSIPSIHMPRWASRLTLTVTKVRVQRLQEISSKDVLAEGVDPDHRALRSITYSASEKKKRDMYHDAHVSPFRTLWNSLHGPDAWNANPWVVAVSFDVQHGNIDQIGGAA